MPVQMVAMGRKIISRNCPNISPASTAHHSNPSHKSKRQELFFGGPDVKTYRIFARRFEPMPQNIAQYDEEQMLNSEAAPKPVLFPIEH